MSRSLWDPTQHRCGGLGGGHNGRILTMWTHGTCCDRANSSYNIVVGCSRKGPGPYHDNMGRDMLRGGGKMVWRRCPVAGDILREGTYEIESERRGYALELVVDFERMPRMRWFNRDKDEPVKPIPSQQLEDVIESWPAGNIDVRIGDYMVRPHQRWAITALHEAGGYLGDPYYKITIAGTDRALAATSEAEVVTVHSVNSPL